MEFDGNRIVINPGGSILFDHLRKIKQTLEFGGILIIPSDTCYSLASLPFNAESIRRIANISPDMMRKEIPLSFSGLRMLEDYCKLTGKDFRAIDKYCPGPITLVCEMKQEMIDKKLDLIINTNKTIGVRIPDSSIERQICDYLNFPLTTCAVRDEKKNIVQNYDDVVSIVRERIAKEMDEYTIMAIEVPHFKYRDASTVISLQPNIIGPYEIKVYREGVVDPKKINRDSKGMTWYDFEDFT